MTTSREMKTCRKLAAKGRAGVLGYYPSRGSNTRLQRSISHSARQNSAAAAAVAEPAYVDVQPYEIGRQYSSSTEDEFWRKVPRWRDLPREEFLAYWWSNMNAVKFEKKEIVRGEEKESFWKGNLEGHLREVLPCKVPARGHVSAPVDRETFINDAIDGVRNASMSVRLTPYMWSRIDWEDPANDPIFKQFVPLKSALVPDHPALKLDSLEEKADSPVEGLVHRYPNKALFLVTDSCPLYCAFCTRSYAVSDATDSVQSKESIKPRRKRIDKALNKIADTPEIKDIVISGGDAFMIEPHILSYICDRLIELPNIKRFRIATKGLAVAPHRFIDPNDAWTKTLLQCHDAARRAGKHMAIHTHFEHPNEISWVTKKAARKLFEAGLTVRNQTVLLRGVNDTAEVQSELIEALADMAVQPYYVYQTDMVSGVEHFRTPLQTIIDIQRKLRGTTAGFIMPSFVVDLPGGGGKRLACDFEEYDRLRGVSFWKSPAIKGRGKEGKVYEYHDPVESRRQYSRDYYLGFLPGFLRSLFR